MKYVLFVSCSSFSKCHNFHRILNHVSKFIRSVLSSFNEDFTLWKVIFFSSLLLLLREKKCLFLIMYFIIQIDVSVCVTEV